MRTSVGRKPEKHSYSARVFTELGAFVYVGGGRRPQSKNIIDRHATRSMCEMLQVSWPHSSKLMPQKHALIAASTFSAS